MLDALVAKYGETLYIRCFPATLVEISPEFRKRLTTKLAEEPRWQRIMIIVQENKALGDNAATLPYYIRDGSLYFNNKERGIEEFTGKSVTPGSRTAL